LDDEHWLIKRVVTDGIVTNSTTETVAPRKARATEPEQKQTDLISEVPTSAPMAPPTSPAPYVAREAPAPAPAPADPTEERICNGCLREYDETKMVTCVDCEDYDLCTTCILNNTHGHHPAHTFTLIRDQEFSLKSLVLSRCKAGRNRQHSAICDGCEKRITGVRHKCLSCPDWDYCAECHQKAAQTHPGHRFVPLYGPIADPPQHREVHAGIYCDGPLCKDKPFPSYIIGVRYKCSICYDTDFCAKCEALPTNSHSRTHPMIMLKTPVQNVSVSTIQANPVGDSIRSFGDLPANPSPVQRTSPVESSKPSPRVNLPKPVVESPVVEATEKPTAPAPESPMKVAEKPADTTDASYRALFERDTVADGTAMPPNKVFEQTWTLYNPGPLAWPAGTFVRFVGGDSMFNVDTNTPLSLSSVNYATESNQLADPVQPGQRANFTVVLKAPSRVGTAISYWRLKLADGTPFGHRLWCDIRVREDVPPVEGESERSAPETETAGSQMIFPKLEKESPAASTHEAATAAPAPSVTNSSDQDILEDVESLTLGDDDTEAGFLTDEEYDILDASDQEYMDARSVRN
jgi:next-to-BRCA1 protein 1